MPNMNNNNMKIKAVIFDMDGVIIDTEPLLAKYWCQAANEFGFPMKYEHALILRSLSEKYASPYLKKTFGESFDYRTVRERRKQLMKENIEKNGIVKKKGVEEALDYLDSTDFITAIATATDLQRAESYLKQAGLYQRFKTICCGSMVKNGKPDPDIYLLAAREIGVPPENCIAVEDSPNGIKSAYGAGMHPVMIPDLTQPDQELSKLLFKKIDSLSELPALLEELRN